MFCKEIMDILEEAFPTEAAMDWDNVGLLVGSKDWQVKKFILPLMLRRPLLMRRSGRRQTSLLPTIP